MFILNDSLSVLMVLRLNCPPQTHLPGEIDVQRLFCFLINQQQNSEEKK